MRPSDAALRAVASAAALLAVVAVPGVPASAGPDPTGPGADVVAAEVRTCPVNTTIGGHVAALHFSRPTAACAPPATQTPGRDLNILNEVVRLTDAAPAGSSIHGHLFAISSPAVGAALERAHGRGVTVRLSGNGSLASSTDAVMASLNAVPHRWCAGPTNDACISSAPAAVSHAKLFTFSATTDPRGTARRDVSWISSSNMTMGGGAEDYNNAVTVYGDSALYTGLRGYLDDLYAMQPRTSDYYDRASGQGHVAARSATVYASPQADRDLVVDRLDDVVPGEDCRVRVMQAWLSDNRPAVAEQLVRMKAGGCRVLVVASSVGPDTLARLRAAGIPVRGTNVHDKTFLVQGRFGGTLASRVYVGSHNITYGAAHVHDEVLVRLAAETPARRPVYDAFTAHFADAYTSATPLWHLGQVG